MTGVKGRRWGTDVYLPSSIDIGAIPYKGANGKLLWLTPGAATQVVTSNGVSPAIPSYMAAAGGGGGGLVLLESHAASASSVLDFTSWYSTTYDDYVIKLINLVPATNADALCLRVSTDGGATYVAASNSYTHGGYFYVNNASTQLGSDGDTKMVCGYGISSTASEGGICGTIEIFSPGDTAANMLMNTDVICCSTGNGGRAAVQRYACRYAANTAVNAIRLIMGGGNITSGIARMYGVAK